MRFINTLHEGETIRGIYLCKTKLYSGDKKWETI